MLSEIPHRPQKQPSSSSSVRKSTTKSSSERPIKLRDSDTDIGRYALKRVLTFAKYSELEQLRTPPPIAWKDVAGNRPLIGKGAFSDVFRVELVGDCTKKYALKRLNSVMPVHAKKFRTGASDLALEARLLECLDHPNIIQLHGIKDGDLVESMNHRDYFLLLDYLVLTLDDQLKRWHKGSSGFLAKLNKRGTHKRLIHRLEHTALGVAKGMEYLHSKVCLKPANCPNHVHNLLGDLTHNELHDFFPLLFRILPSETSNQTMLASMRTMMSKFSILGWQGIYLTYSEAVKF